MVTFAIHSNDPDPRRLYEYSWSSPPGSDRVEGLVGLGDCPLDLVVDVKQRHLLWTFIAEHQTDSSRAGYFIAEYQANSEELFHGLQNALQSLQYGTEWTVPHAETLRRNAGFELWRVTSDLPGLTQETRRRLFEHLASNSGYLEFRMSSYRHALQAVKAIYDEDLPCTVAVDGEQRDEVPSDVDILFRPTGDTDFEPVSDAARALLNSSSTPNAVRGATDGGSIVLSGLRIPDQLSVPFTGLLLVGFLGIALSSFVGSQLVHPITGLATLGGFLGALLAFPGTASLMLDRSENRSDETVLGMSLRALRDQRSLSLLAVTYGTVLGFAYPTLFRIAGTVVGSPWLFGVVTELGAGIVSVVTLTLLSLGVTWFLATRTADLHLDRERIIHLVSGHAVFATTLLLATGLASSLWYGLLPAV